MKFALLYSFRRILRKKSKILLMGFFLSLGFWGWLLSESSQTSIKNNLANNAKQVLSSDISISARRELTPQEIEGMRTTLSGKADVIKGYEFFAMLTSSTDTRLVLVRVVEDFYPFYGQLVLSPESSAPNLKGQNLWAYEEFKTLFGIGLDEKVKLGDLEFRVSAFVKEDKTQTFRLASLAPRVFIHMDDLKKTGLIQFGSTFTTTFFIKTYRESEVKSLTEKLKKTLQDPAIDITSFQSLPDDESSPSQRLADFLGLTSLVSLLFSALSLFYLIQIWSVDQKKERMLLTYFGLSRGKLFIMELIQSSFLSLFSTFMSLALLFLTRPFLESFMKNWSSSGFQFSISLNNILLILVSQLLLILVISNPISQSQKGSHVKGFIPLMALLWPYSILASHSILNGSLFFLGLVFVSISLVALGSVTLKLISNVSVSHWTISLALKSLVRQSTASWAFILTIGTSSALLNLLPQIQNSLESMISFDEVKKRPSLFVFDIQNEQWPDFQNSLKSFQIFNTVSSPLVRARILKINDIPFERKESDSLFKTREEETELRFRNRGINMTYRKSLQPEEQIVKGEPFDFQYHPDQKLASISLEKRYAGRIGVEIDDIITFDVQGIEIKAQVKNLRQVKWSRFEPNFFILFQDGLLNDAPQTHLAAIPFVENETKMKIMKTLSKEFPNISIIDVERLLKSIIENLEKISVALKLMTALALLSGLLTITFLLLAESQRRSFEVHLLKTLGASLFAVFKTRFLEALTMGAVSLFVGVFSSYLISYLIIDQVFQIPFVPTLWPLFFIGFSVFSISLLVCTLTVRSVYKKNSFSSLKKEE